MHELFFASQIIIDVIKLANCSQNILNSIDRYFSTLLLQTSILVSISSPLGTKDVPENWIEVSVLVELRTVRIMTQGESNLRPL